MTGIAAAAEALIAGGAHDAYRPADYQLSARTHADRARLQPPYLRDLRSRLSAPVHLCLPPSRLVQLAIDYNAAGGPVHFVPAEESGR
jgi:hypothetical protein